MQLVYSAEVLLFCKVIDKRINAIAPFWPNFKNSVTLEIGLLPFHPFTVRHMCFLIIVDIGSLPSFTSVVQTVGSMVQTFPVKHLQQLLQCLAERSHFKTEDMFLLLNPHLGGHQFHNNKEEEMAVGKLLQMSMPHLYCDGINLCQDGTDASQLWGIMLNRNGTLLE